ncbi:AP-5 complex subunit zeta-1 isoform X1 [Hydra vulgaris]|nr:AP-5 complex subunit zeta-1-like [Hydra vulgaris]
MSSEIENEIHSELRYLCKCLLNKFSSIKEDKKVSVIEDLRVIVWRLMIDKSTCSFSPPAELKKKLYEDLIELSLTKDKKYALAFNLSIKLMVIFLLRILHYFEPCFSISYQFKMSNSIKTDAYYLDGLLLQRSLDLTLKDNIITSLKYNELQGIGFKKCLLFLPSTYSFLWSFTDAIEISQYLCQLLIMKNNTATKSRLTSIGSTQKSSLVQTNELDGSISRDIFTVLNLSKVYNEQQMLNVYSFSILKSWLQFVDNQVDIADCLSSGFNKFSGSTLSRSSSRIFDNFFDSDSVNTSLSSSSSCSSIKSFDGESNADQLDLGKNRTPDKSRTPLHFDGPAFDSISIKSDILVNSSSSLKSVAVRYCLRLIFQSEKVPKQDSDRSVITASVVEAISILIILCKNDPILAQRVYPDIKRLYKRIENPRLTARKVFLSLLQFFVTYHADTLMPIDEILDLYFKEIPCKYLNNEIACYELVQFCLDNKSFCSVNEVVLKYTPNIFKIFAWWCCSFLEDSFEFVEMVTNSSNCSELLSIILDLPCLAYLLNLKSQKVLDDEVKMKEQLGQNYTSKLYKDKFTFIMRETLVGYKTVDKIAELHKLMKPFESYPRVQYSSEVVPHLLKSYFNKLKHLGDPESLTSIYPIILERIFLLFPQNSSQKKIIKIFCEEVCNIVSFVPDVISTYHKETIALFNQFTFSKFVNTQPFLSRLAWCISLGIESCKDKSQALQYYETFETIIYGMISSFSGQEDPEIICSFISTLSKLATFSQEMIPRAIICLNKLSSAKFETDEPRFQYVVTFSKELSSILKRPKVAESILCGLSKPKPWHLDPHDSLLMKIHFLTSKFT